MWATPIAWYAVTQVFYQHGLAFALVALGVERWDASYGQSDVRRFVWLGLIGGAAMTMRAQEAIYLLLPGGEILVRLWRGPRWSDRRVGNGAVQPHGVKYWCLGNEMDGPWQIGHMPAADYGRKAADAARQMRGVDRSIILATFHSFKCRRR